MIRSVPFDFPYDGNLIPSHTALMVIDLQVGFLSNKGYFAQKGYSPEPLRKIVPTVVRLVEAARAGGFKIIWTRQGYRADMADASDYDRWRMSRTLVAGRRIEDGTILRGTPDFELIPELIPEAGDVVVDKTANGAFYQTDLEMILKSNEITHLLFSGCTTDVCVHTTLREAVDRKFQCLLIEDACASADQYAHEAAVHMVTVEDGVFGVVATSNDVFEALAHNAIGEAAISAA